MGFLQESAACDLHRMAPLDVRNETQSKSAVQDYYVAEKASSLSKVRFKLAEVRDAIPRFQMERTNPTSTLLYNGPTLLVAPG
ncbi:MAG: hypothetical protein P4L43_02325 [Syntrophobacteraceae bacterium]|nr:hypothetical protein [Syntrophobacteraceae bacterium]